MRACALPPGVSSARRSLPARARSTGEALCAATCAGVVPGSAQLAPLPQHSCGKPVKHAAAAACSARQAWRLQGRARCKTEGGSASVSMACSEVLDLPLGSLQAAARATPMRQLNLPDCSETVAVASPRLRCSGAGGGRRGEVGTWGRRAAAHCSTSSSPYSAPASPYSAPASPCSAPASPYSAPASPCSAPASGGGGSGKAGMSSSGAASSSGPGPPSGKRPPGPGLAAGGGDGAARARLAGAGDPVGTCTMHCGSCHSSSIGRLHWLKASHEPCLDVTYNS